MLSARITGVSAVALSFSLCMANAQTRPSQERLEAIQKRMANVKQEAISKVPPGMLSGGSRNFLQVANTWPNIQHGVNAVLYNDATLANLETALRNRPRSTKPVTSSGPIPVSNPSTDFLFSVSAGFTESETSTAWCGNNVVTGFNDSGSYLETLLFGPGGLSFSGSGASNDGGYSFLDSGYINPGPNFFNFLEGDPVVNCTDANTFYYSQLGASGTSSTFTSVVFLSKSTDGGYTWNDPIPAVSKDAFTHSLDKDWSAISPRNTKVMYVSYTDFDFTFTTCPSAERIAIEIVHSIDGGNSWSAPTVVSEVCSDAGQFVQGSQIAVDSLGRVYVSWENFPTGFGETRELWIVRSTDRAASFGPPSKIDNAIATGDGTDLQGDFRTWLTGNLAVDRSGTKTDGDLYLTWEDGRFRSRTDFFGPSGLYRNANVLISRSADGGKTWSPAVRVNNDSLESSVGVGIDHFQPGAAVDSTGTVAVCWYDRRDDPLDYQISRYCGTSTDQGTSWTNGRVDPNMWPPIHDSDILIASDYLGDYDTVVSDNTKASTGFQGAYGNVTLRAQVANQDVFLVHVNK